MRSQRELDQGKAELPGFDARTRIDDAIGKLIALRRRLALPIPNGLLAALDDVDEATDRAVALGFDEDAPLGALFGAECVKVPVGSQGRRREECLPDSAVDLFRGQCSCGGLWLTVEDDES